MTFSLRAGFLWTPPEALREDSGENNDIEAINERCRCSTNSGDIYSVAVIIKETFCRNAPYQEYEDDFTPKGRLQVLLLTVVIILKLSSSSTSISSLLSLSSSASSLYLVVYVIDEAS